MKEIKDALLRMVMAENKIEKMRKAYVEANLDDNMLFEAIGDIHDAIHALVGHGEDYINGATNIVMSAPILTIERRVEMLYAEFRKNHPVLSSPVITDREEMKKMFKENGGYLLRETPEGDWS